MVDSAIQRYLDIIATKNKNSASTVSYFLQDFQTFCEKDLGAADKANPVAEVIVKLKAGRWNASPREEQPYDVMGRYARWLVTNRLETGDNNARSVSNKISWARKLLEINFIPISKTAFRALVMSPRPEDPDISPVKKETIRSIILALPDPRMQTYALFLASAGWRATESLTLTIGNLENFDIKTLKFTGTPFINASGKYAKTKRGKRRQLTAEMGRQIEKLLAFNYRKRRIHYKLPNGKYVNRHVTLTPKLSDPLFAPYHSEVSDYHKLAQTNKIDKNEALNNLYGATSKKFRHTTDRLGIKWEDDSKRRAVTLHSMRRFVYTQCKRTVNEGYAKYHIGRKTHEYDKSTEEEVAADFSRVEPILTFMDTAAVEAKQQSLEKEIIEIRKRLDKLPRLEDL